MYQNSKTLIAMRKPRASKGISMSVAISTKRRDFVTLIRGYPNL